MRRLLALILLVGVARPDGNDPPTVKADAAAPTTDATPVFWEYPAGHLTPVVVLSQDKAIALAKEREQCRDQPQITIDPSFARWVAFVAGAVAGGVAVYKLRK